MRGRTGLVRLRPEKRGELVELANCIRHLRDSSQLSYVMLRMDQMSGLGTPTTALSFLLAVHVWHQLFSASSLRTTSFR